MQYQHLRWQVQSLGIKDIRVIGLLWNWVLLTWAWSLLQVKTLDFIPSPSFKEKVSLLMLLGFGEEVM
jgi:hypothetical protein